MKFCAISVKEIRASGTKATKLPSEKRSVFQTFTFQMLLMPVACAPNNSIFRFISTRHNIFGIIMSAYNANELV